MHTTTTRRLGTLALTATLALVSFSGVAVADDWTDRARAHYERVERELRQADVSHLTAAQRERRTELLDELARYRATGDFGRQDDVPGARIPQFVDDDGRHCAVAHLLRSTGRTDLVLRVRSADNEAYVSDLAADRDLLRWLDGVGLTAREAARIQFPGFWRGRPPTGVPVKEQESIGGGEERESDSSGRPADGGTAPSTGAPEATATAPASGGLGARFTPGGGLPADWRVWWELQKLSWFDVHELAPDDEQTLALEDRRAAVAPLLHGALSHDDAGVRGAAAVALARVSGEGAVDALVSALDDPQIDVRERALVALGATGSPVAVRRLLRTANPKSRRAEKAAERVSRAARPLAIVGLAVAEAYGAEDDLVAPALTALRDAKKRDLTEVGTAVLAFHRISPDDRLPPVALGLLEDENVPTALRSHALDGAGLVTDARDLRMLQRLHEGRHVDLRRAASVVLGNTRNDLVLPRLQSAFEAEREPLTRGLTLLSIASHGGDTARIFLAEQLASGGSTDRAWAALALGRMARDGDDAALPLLRGAELGDDDRGALSLALGLARDGESLALLRSELTVEGAPARRAYAASGLALLGTDAARFALLECLQNESSELVRANAAQGLGSMGHAEDASFLLRELRRAPSGPLQAVTAAGVGFHGSADAVDGLIEMLGDDSLSASGRAAVVQALGILLDRRPGLLFPAIGRDTNFTALPDWALRVLRMTL